MSKPLRNNAWIPLYRVSADPVKNGQRTSAYRVLAIGLIRAIVQH
jgi:hypothetical protein